MERSTGPDQWKGSPVLPTGYKEKRTGERDVPIAARLAAGVQGSGAGPNQPDAIPHTRLAKTEVDTKRALTEASAPLNSDQQPSLHFRRALLGGVDGGALAARFR
jgi:hypothetical protein